VTIPRDISGERLIRLLARYGYASARQVGSHVILASTLMGHEGHVSVPLHRALRVGTVAGIIGKVAEYLERPRDEVRRELFS
jgi:predicted RNA binding protein YcfA (HicA-like mRNA interferase family)